MPKMSEEISWFNVGLLICIACLAVGAIWVASTTIGPFLAPPYWLLIIGGIGVVCFALYAKYKE